MSKTMPKSTIEEKLRWIKPILDGKITIKNMVQVCPFCERTLKYWLANFKQSGLAGLVNKSTRPKSHPQETSIRIKEQVIELRQETGLCAQKLAWRLNKQGIHLHHRTIGKIIKTEGLTRKYRVRKVKYKYVKAQLQPGDLVEIDVKYVPQLLGSRRFYQFTAIDCATRWRYIKIYEAQGNHLSLDFFNQVIQNFPHKILAIKTDNASIFTNRYTGYIKSIHPLNPRLHILDLECQRLNIQHYLIDPGKPAQNGHVERSHRTDQEQFYNQVKFNSFEELKYKIKLWNMYYNDLEHCALNGLTPNQALGLRVQNVCV
ncbi:MAG: integrase core domain-containing protein [Patescibacteria group bacterium]|nr:integrase core domain-containing protein [Patescibacteria group bacterium]